MSVTKKNESLNSLTNKLVDIVFSETILSKPNIEEKIRIALSVWTRSETRRKDYSNIKTNKQVLAVTLEKERFERTFWYDIFKELVPKEERESFYDRFHQNLKDGGFEQFSK